MSGDEIPPSQTPYPDGTDPNQSDPLFDSVALTQGNLPHLIELLVQQYRAYIGRENEKRAAMTPAREPLDPEPTIQQAGPLLNFFRAYLTEHRPAEVFALDANYGLMLTNSMRCAISPGTPTIKGSMQDSGAVSISHGRSQPGMGTKPGGAIEM